jgi:carbamoyl-phosphate synthase large subunit
MNLLIPSIGRSYHLAKFFAEALDKRGAKLIAADVSTLASGLYGADDAALVPPTNDPEFWPHIDELVEELEISRVLPVRGGELLLWAKRYETGMLAAKVLTSPVATLATCLDKWALFEAIKAAGVHTPTTVLAVPDELSDETFSLPVVIKPRHGTGTGAANVRVVESVLLLEAELIERSDRNEESIVQQFVPGEQYTVDAYIARTGKMATAVVRKRISVRAGQTDIGETVYDPELVALTRDLIESLPFRGAINLQFIRGFEGNGGSKPLLIDVNPHFSSAIAITRAAGVDLAEYTVRELFGEKLPETSKYELVTHLGYSDGISLPSGSLGGR